MIMACRSESQPIANTEPTIVATAIPTSTPRQSPTPNVEATVESYVAAYIGRHPNTDDAADSNPAPDYNP